MMERMVTSSGDRMEPPQARHLCETFARGLQAPPRRTLLRLELPSISVPTTARTELNYGVQQELLQERRWFATSAQRLLARRHLIS